MTGKYDLGTVDGTVKDRVLTLRYREADAAGQAKFTLAADGLKFQGTWQQDGTVGWLPWNGKRIETKPLGFAGLWETTFGMMRLTGNGGEVRGAYDYASGPATIAGEIKAQRLIFRYREPDRQGSASFELSEDAMSITGKWREDGDQNWRPWTGKRVVPEAGKIWLVVLEANWERSIDEQEYAFGDMLTNYFTMATARHIHVRHRFFHDATDLRRFCEKIQFLAEPVVLLISTHGTREGITVFGRTINANVVAESLVGADNLKLLHLSGCAMMSGDFPQQIHAQLKDRARFPISGYQTSVAWDASALGDFTFLSLLMIRRLEPAAAARQAVLASPYLGDQVVPGSVFQPLGLTVVPAPTSVTATCLKSTEQNDGRSVAAVSPAVALSPHVCRHIIDDGVQIFLRLEANRLSDSRQVGNAATDIFKRFVIRVTVALKIDLGSGIDSLNDSLGKLQNRNRHIAANIVHAPRCIRRIDQFSDRTHDIIDVGKTANLTAVVVNRQRTAVDCCSDEPRQHHPIRAGLPGPHNIKESAHHNRQFLFFVKRQSQELIDCFGDSIAPPRFGGRAEYQVIFFTPDLFGVLAVDFAGAGQEAGNQVATRGPLSQTIQNQLCRVNVSFDRLDRLLGDQGDAHGGRQVIDAFRPINDAGNQTIVFDGAFDVFKPIVVHHIGQVIFFAGRQIVDDDHAMALGQQPLREMRTNESGTAGDKTS